MAKNNNLNDFLTDVANSIRTKKGTTALINAQNFSSEIASIETGIIPTGNINITNTNTTDVTNYATAKVVDSNLVASNIKKNITILGVTGTLEGAKEEEEKTVDLSMASGNQVITPTSGKVMNKVTITKPSTLLAENIKNGVNIGGVTGTYTGSGSGSLNWVELDYTNCSFNNESVFLSPEVSKILNDELTSYGERMIIIRFMGTFLHDDFGDVTVKIMITFSKTDTYVDGAGGAVIRGSFTPSPGNNKINVDTILDTTNGTSIKIYKLSAPSDFSNPNITLLDYVAIDI